MSKMLQIRNVPEKLHRALKVRAAQEGLSMSELVLREIRRVLERPSREEILARLAKLPRVELSPSAAEIVREERDRR